MKIDLFPSYSFISLGFRRNQEDARFPDADSASPQQKVFIVCDGVGGNEKGELASKTVAQAFGNYMESLVREEPFLPDDFKKALEHAYAELDKVMCSENNRSMATTLTFVAFGTAGVLCAHIGDSRIYHIRPGSGILYRSEDHSLVNELVHAGVITPQQAKNHPRKNVITRCMGALEDDEEKSPATIKMLFDIRKDDYFFLCTDGVSGTMDDKDLFSVISSSELSDKEKAEKIKDLCKNSSDNNTAWLIHVENVERDSLDKELEEKYSEAFDSDYKEQETGESRKSKVPVQHYGNYTDSIINKINGFFNRIFR